MIDPLTARPSAPGDAPFAAASLVGRLWQRHGPRLRSLAPYGAALILPLLIVALTEHLWRFDFRTPLRDGGDATLHMMFTKAFVENGWYLRNPFLGAPGAMEMYEFPAADTLPGLCLKLLGLLTHNPAILNNLFYLLTYPLTALTALYACRQLRLSTGPALLASLLYALLPYHFYRSVSHIYLSAYFMIPLVALTAWWIATGQLFCEGDGVRKPRRPLLAAAFCLVASMSGIYYPFFCCVVLSAATLMALCARRDWRHFLAGGTLTGLLAAGMLACLAPSLWYLHKHPHPPASHRYPGESELYGLKIVQVILPIDSHRIATLRNFKRNYNLDAPLYNENSSAAIGAVGACGFLLLIGWLLFRPIVRDRESQPAISPLPARQLLDTFSVLNGSAILFATIGGFGSLFAMLVSPQVRSINRISVFIAFFSLVALATCLDEWASRRQRRASAFAIRWGMPVLLLGVGWFDQTLPPDIGYYKLVHHEYRAEDEFFHKIESSIPANGMVFELPYMVFPEGDHVERMGDYSHFRGYIHTERVRWSYGAMRGSEEDLWQQRVTSLPTDQFARQLAFRGFSGIFLERDGYPDDGAAMETGLRRLLGAPVATRERRLFFSLAAYTKTLQGTMTPEQWKQAQELSAHFPVVSFLQGFSEQERSPEHAWRWCSQDGEMRIVNTSAKKQRVLLRMLANTGSLAPAHLVLKGEMDSQTWTINPDPQTLSMAVDVLPGEHVFHFLCDGKPIDAPTDRRVMVWDMTDLQIDQEQPPTE